MNKLRNFNCPECGTFEAFASDQQLNKKCECGRMAKKIVSAARYFGNTTGKSPSANS